MPTVQNSQNASPQALIDNYLDELRQHLRRLPRLQADDIVEEIRSHIRDAASGPNGVTEVSVRRAIAHLGPASDLAGNYVTDTLLARAAKSRMPWTILRGIFHWATISVKGLLVFFICLIGYAFGGSFFLAALIKPFSPKTGLWLIESGHYSLALGMTDRWPQGHELLGWKLIPIGLALGGGTILATTHFALWCIRQFRNSRAMIGFKGAGQ